MATLIPGPLGRPNGKAGRLVYYMLKDQVVCRSIGIQRNKPTEKQLANRQAMKVTMRLLKHMKTFIEPGFLHQTKGTLSNSFNLATAYNKKNALQGEFPNISVDYSKVVLSQGELPMAKELLISKTTEGILVKWDRKDYREGDRRDDIVMVVLHHPADQSATVTLNAGKREAGECLIRMSVKKLATPMEAYIAFKRSDGKAISDSVYLGNINGKCESEEETENNEKYTKLKNRVEEVRILWQEQETIYEETGVNNRSRRHLKKEYDVLKDKLKEMPGKMV